MLRLFTLILTAVVLLPLYSAAAAGNPEGREMSLAECTSVALSHHPGVTAAERRVVEAQERLAATKGVKLPQIAFRTEAQTYDWLPPNKAKVLGGGSTDVYSAVTFNKLLYSSGRAEADIDSAAAMIHASEEDFRRTSQTVVFRVTQAYYNVLRAEAVLAARAEAVAQMEQHLNVAQERYAIGKAAKLDVLRAEVQLADVTQSRSLAASQLGIARLELLNAMGVDTAAEQIALVEDRNPAPSFSDADKFISDALEIHPEYRKSRYLAKAAEHGLRSAKGDGGPELSILGSYNREGKDIPDIDNWNVGLAITMPIYTGGITKAKMRQAEAVVDQREAGIDLTRQSILLAVRSALLATQDAANRLQATSKSVEQAREALRVAQEKYNAGLGSGIEVIDAQVALAQAETNYAHALYDGKIAVAQLDYAVGRDPERPNSTSPGTGGMDQ